MAFEYDVYLDYDKIMKAYKDFSNIDDIIQEGIDEGIKEFTERLVYKLKENMINYGLGGSKLIDSIECVTSEDGVTLIVDQDYAMFVEYGTGIVGSLNPHPHPTMYDVNDHGFKGWYYPTDSSDPNPTAYTNKNGVTYAWTKGMPSRPYMYKTWLWGRRTCITIIRKNINRKLKEMF